MPTYSYKCEECQHEFDAFQKISEEPIKECPECTDGKLNKVFKSAPNFSLSGGGWTGSNIAGGGR